MADKIFGSAATSLNNNCTKWFNKILSFQFFFSSNTNTYKTKNQLKKKRGNGWEEIACYLQCNKIKVKKKTTSVFRHIYSKAIFFSLALKNFKNLRVFKLASEEFQIRGP